MQTDVAVDSQGNILLFGGFYSTIDFGGQVLSTSDLGAYLVKLDAAGNHVWTSGPGGTARATGTAVAITSTDESLIVVASDDPVDLGGGG